jgi:ribosome-associated protein
MIMQVEETRSQARNREMARERLAELIRAALVAPNGGSPPSRRLGSQRRRITAKVQRGEVKSLRGKIGDEE